MNDLGSSGFIELDQFEDDSGTPPGMDSEKRPLTKEGHHAQHTAK
jgi:hypothetical protein